MAINDNDKTKGGSRYSQRIQGIQNYVFKVFKVFKVPRRVQF